jgi:photosystem II stability/assembly factor-like uncharacterized protein
MSPPNPRSLYVGTFWAGMSKTTDRGGTWKPVNRGMGRVPVLSVAVDPCNPDTAYAGTKGHGAFKTTAGGQTWTPINNGLTSLEVPAVAVDPSSPETLYADAHDICQARDSVVTCR